MTGYVVLNPAAATDDEKRRYSRYYCGLCKAIDVLPRRRSATT